MALLQQALLWVLVAAKKYSFQHRAAGLPMGFRARLLRPAERQHVGGQRRPDQTEKVDTRGVLRGMAEPSPRPIDPKLLDENPIL